MRITQGTFSFLPDLTDGQILKQVEHCLARGWAVGIEYTDDPHPRNTYWEMYGMPMFDLQDAAGVLLEVQGCRQAFPNHYIRVTAFDGARRDGGARGVGFETTIFPAATARPVVVNGNVTEFPARAANAEMQLTIQNQSTPDASANGKDSHGVYTAARAKTPFSIRDGAHVVEQGCRQACHCPDRIAQWNMRPCAMQVGEKECLAFFKVEHAGQRIDVHFTNIPPDTFQEGGEVVLVGSFDASGKVFESEDMNAKCPSKYENEVKAPTVAGTKKT